MEPYLPSNEYRLRQAEAADAAAIRQIIHLAHINPTGLAWQRFILAVDRRGSIIGCGQLKPHRDGSLELASIAVLGEWRGKGVARTVIEHLLERQPGRLYLTCRAELGPMYRKFGFEVVNPAEMPAYFRRLSRMVNLWTRLTHQVDKLLVMRRN
jgi:N-acetylglutamate synthase-like GNAT family acetyltransferase